MLAVMLPKHAKVGVPKIAERSQFRREPTSAGAGRTNHTTSNSKFGALQFSFLLDNSTLLPLKTHHEKRPLWVSEDGRIYVETFSPWYEAAQEFLIAIAEPSSRPALIHEYQLTPYSLYAGTSIGLETDVILKVLERLSNNIEDYPFIFYI